MNATELTVSELKYLRGLMVDDLSKNKQQTAGWENLYSKLLEISNQSEIKEAANNSK